MVVETDHQKSSGVVQAAWIEGFKRVLKKLVKDDPVRRVLKKLVKDDPRRVVHSFKFGLALTLISLFYSVRPLFNGVGESGMWAVLTVVVVFEFTVGATMSRFLHRSFGTLAGGAVGVGAVHLASLFGAKAEPVVLTVLVYLIVAGATLSRFVPRIKERHDYGVIIFILTVSLVTVSSHRVEENIVALAVDRISTVIIGGAICVAVSAFVFPVWAGHDLHTLVANNVDNLGLFLEGFETEYFTNRNPASKGGDDHLQSHKGILTSKAKEDSLATFSIWELYFHGRLTLPVVNHPRKKCVEIGNLARQFAYLLEALKASGFVKKLVSRSDDQLAGAAAERELILIIFQECCSKIAVETSKILRELALAMKTRKVPNRDTINTNIEKSRKAVKELADHIEYILLIMMKYRTRSLNDSSSSILTQSSYHQDQDQYQLIMMMIMHFAAVMSLLISTVDSAVEISKAVYALADLANFNSNIININIAEGTVNVLKPDNNNNNNNNNGAVDHVISIQAILHDHTVDEKADHFDCTGESREIINPTHTMPPRYSSVV